MGTPTRYACALSAAWLAACATAPPGPALELTADCRLEAAGGSGRRGGGFGGGAPEEAILLASAPPPPPPSSDRGSGVDAGAVAAGVGAAALLGGLLYAHRTDPVQVLRRDGPILPAAFSMSCLPVRGFVAGGWPVVVDYLSDGASQVSLEVHLGAGGPAYVQGLESGAGRHLQRFDLPRNLPDSPSPALLLVKARRSGEGGPGQMQLLGLGAGPRAVGSVAIDQVDFSPPALRRSARQQAAYSFYSRSDFNRLAVAVMRVLRAPGELKIEQAREYRYDSGVGRGTRFGPKGWDGSDAKDRTSLGPHLLQVRAWVSEDEKSWVTAWSFSSVQVSD